MPHHMHAVDKRPIATDVACVVLSVCLCVCVCVGHTAELCKTGEPIEMPLRDLIHVGSRNYVGLYYGVKIERSRDGA